MKLAVGIDIGGTITKIGLVSEDGKCIKKTSFRTKEINNFSDYIQELYSSIESITDNPNSICGIGTRGRERVDVAIAIDVDRKHRPRAHSRRRDHAPRPRLGTVVLIPRDGVVTN